MAANNLERPTDPWRWVELGEISEVVSKGTTPTTLGFSFAEAGIPFLRAEDISGGVIDPNSVAFHIDPKTHNSALARSHLKPGDLLITIAGSLGRVGYVPNDAPPLNCNQAVAFIFYITIIALGGKIVWQISSMLLFLLNMSRGKERTQWLHLNTSFWLTLLPGMRRIWRSGECCWRQAGPRMASTAIPPLRCQGERHWSSTWARVGSDGRKIREGIDFGEVGADGRLVRITGFFGPPPPVPPTFPEDLVF